jgi:ribosomal-protein-alanine N-acetyltransferase
LTRRRASPIYRRTTMALSDVTWRPPRLETDRLLLRGWEPGDAEAVFAYASDPEVTPFMAWDRHQSIDDAHAFLDGFVAAHYAEETADYCITLRDDPGVAIGGIGLYRRPHVTMELGYVLHRSAWGRGYVPEAGRRLIGHAFDTTDVARIYAAVFAENAKSRRAAEKMGLVFEGVLRSAASYRGRRWDEAIYAIVRDD